MPATNHRGDATITTRAREGEEPQTFKLALTLAALEEIERESGHSSFITALTELGGKGADGVQRYPSARALMIVLRACIRAGGEPDMSDDEINALPFHLEDVIAAIGALAASITPEQEAGDKPKARPPRQTGRSGS